VIPGILNDFKDFCIKGLGTGSPQEARSPTGKLPPADRKNNGFRLNNGSDGNQPAGN